MHIDLSGRTSLVTGAGQGIGKATALSLSKSGSNVVAVDIDSEGIERLVADLKSRGSRALAVKADISIAKEVNLAVDQAEKEFGGVDILVNNAGVIVRKPAEDITEEEWNHVLDVNLKGPFICSCTVAKRLIYKRKGGRIINISSIMGAVGLTDRSAYSSSKSGLFGLTRDLSIEWAKHGITVNAVCPGWIITEFTKNYFAKEDVKKYLLDRTPLGRFGTPEEVASMITYLASDMASFVTGGIFFVDGGWTAI